MTNMQKNILTNLTRAMTPADMANVVDSYPGPVGRSMQSLKNLGHVRDANGGKFARTADGTKALRATS